MNAARTWNRTRNTACAVVTGAVLLGACAPTLNWREWRSSDAAVALTMPCKPVRQQRTVQLAGAARPLVLEVCDAGGDSWALASVALTDTTQAVPVLTALTAAALGNVGAAGTAGQAVALPGAIPPAPVRYRVQGKRPDGQPVTVRVLLFAHAHAAVQATVIGSQIGDDAAETFLSSVRVLR